MRKLVHLFSLTTLFLFSGCFESPKSDTSQPDIPKSENYAGGVRISISSETYPAALGTYNLNSGSFSWSIETKPSVKSVVCLLDGETQGAPIDCTGRSSYNVTNLDDGLYNFVVEAMDTSGHSIGKSSFPFSVDTIAPLTVSNLVSLTHPDPALPYHNTTATFKWTPSSSQDVVSTVCKIDSDQWFDCPNSNSYTANDLADGSHVFSIRVRDKAGNYSPSASVTALVDTSAPGAVTISGSTPAVAATGFYLSSNITFKWTTLENGLQYRCKLDSLHWETCTSNISYSVVVNSDGPHSIFVKTVDTAGNESPTTSYAFAVDTQAPIQIMPAFIGFEYESISTGKMCDKPVVIWNQFTDANGIKEATIKFYSDSSCSNEVATFNQNGQNAFWGVVGFRPAADYNPLGTSQWVKVVVKDQANRQASTNCSPEATIKINTNVWGEVTNINNAEDFYVTSNCLSVFYYGYISIHIDIDLSSLKSQGKISRYPAFGGARPYGNSNIWGALKGVLGSSHTVRYGDLLSQINPSQYGQTLFPSNYYLGILLPGQSTSSTTYISGLTVSGVNGDFIFP